jgi:hypothetical protein
LPFSGTFNSGGNGGQSSAVFNGTTLVGGGGTGGGGTLSAGSGTNSIFSATMSGGNGGSASGGTTNTTGQSGSASVYSRNLECSSTSMTSGKGGNGASGGSGGVTATMTPQCANYGGSSVSGVAGNAGSAPGGGGSSGIGAGMSMGTGGNGAAGRVQIIIASDIPDPVAVTFGGVTATCSVDSDTQLTCTTPAHTAGAVSVLVGGVSAGTYTYIDPPILELSLRDTPVSLSGLPNVLLTDYITANVITNNPNGYHLDVEASEPRLKCTISSGGTSTDYYIEPLSATGAIVDNKWGFIKNNGATLTTPTTTDNWTGITTTPTEIDSYNLPTDLTNGRDTIIWFGTRVNYTLPACVYAGTTTITAVGN